MRVAAASSSPSDRTPFPFVVDAGPARYAAQPRTTAPGEGEEGAIERTPAPNAGADNAEPTDDDR